MKYFWRCERSALAEALSGKRFPASEQLQPAGKALLPKNSPGEIFVFWDVDDFEVFELPMAIIVSTGETADFLAWIATYFRKLRPFTSHCRVLDIRQVSELSKARPEKSSHIKDLAVSLILAEMWSILPRRRVRDDFSPVGYRKTLSFAVAQLAIRNPSSVALFGESYNFLLERWHRLQILGPDREQSLPIAVVAEVWHIVVKALNPTKAESDYGRPAVELLRKAINGKSLEISDFGDEIQKNEGLLLAWDALYGRKEKRVEAIYSALKSLMDISSREKLIGGMYAGFIVSRVDPGSLDHFEILTPILKSFPQAVFWYSVFAALQPRNSVCDYADSLGWFIRKDLRGGDSDILGVPNVDISYDELLIINQSSEVLDVAIKTRNLEYLDVEIYPHVTVSIDTISAGSRKSFEYAQEELFREVALRDANNGKLQTELIEYKNQLEGIARRMAKVLEETERQRRKRI